MDVRMLTGSKQAQEMVLQLLPLIPLAGSILAGSMPRRNIVSGIAAFAASLASFATTLLLFCWLAENNDAPVTAVLWTWFDAAGVKAHFSLYFDRLAGVMALVVTGVGSAIHLYAVGYMAQDPAKPRFFACLNLFLFAMLLLVLGGNLLVLFAGWEGVGLCSYLLIGFWYRDMRNAEAAQKAFIVNRIGDAGFLLGILLLYRSTGSFQFLEIERSVPSLVPEIKEWAALLLLIGAVGKSAQIPLYVWLPDAMAGPTPVSALIHAATMVTAGVYMIVRLHILFAAAPHVSLLIAVLGTATAFFAAAVALVQTDIKKMLAYSTISQLGYMFLALGVQAYSSGIYHLVTHAFFKALLFLAAGSVILGCHHEQDMRRYGGLWQNMAITFFAYLVGVYAIIGLPFGSGFYSKDGILWAVYSDPGPAGSIHLAGALTVARLLFWAAVFTSFLTALYMIRSLVLTFFGGYRGQGQPEEQGPVMLVPVAVLMILSAFFGATVGRYVLYYLEPWGRGDIPVWHDQLGSGFAWVEHVTLTFVAAGALLPFLIYLRPELLQTLAARFTTLSTGLQKGWGVDELYQNFVIRPLRGTAQFIFAVVDRRIIDATVDETAALVLANGLMFSRLQHGRIRGYALTMFVFAVLLIALRLAI